MGNYTVMAGRLVFENGQKTLRIRFSEGRYTLESAPKRQSAQVIELDESAMDALASAWPKLRSAVREGDIG